MRHDPVIRQTSELEADLRRDERAHIAETHRFVLHRGHDLINLCARATGADGEHQAVTFRETLLWVEGAAESSLLATMASRLAEMTDLSDRDRRLRDELHCLIERLAKSAQALRCRRPVLADRGPRRRRSG